MNRPDVDSSVLVRITASRRLVQFGIDFCVSVMVARLMTPAEVGAFSVAMAAIVIASGLRSAGVGTYIIQARDIDAQKTGSTMGLALCVAMLLAGIVALASGPIAAFYQSPAIKSVLCVIALSFLCVPIQTVAAALLARELRFGRNAIAEISGSGLGGLTSVFLAWKGHGAMALAWGALVNAVVVAAVYALVAPSVFWSRPRLDGWKAVWGVSGWAVGAGLVSQLGSRTNEIVTGKTLGIAEAAQLDRAESLPRVIWGYLLPTVVNVVAPLTARNIRDNVDIRGVTLRRMRFFGAVFVPLLIGLGSLADYAIIVLFGPQWLPAVVPTFWICIAAAVTGQVIVLNSIFVGMGRTKPVFIAMLWEQGARIIMLALLGTMSIVAVSKGYIAVALVHAASLLILSVRHGIINKRDIAPALKPGLISGVSTMLAGGAIKYLVGVAGITHPIVALLLSSGALGLFCLVMLWFVERDALRFVGKVLRISKD